MVLECFRQRAVLRCTGAMLSPGHGCGLWLWGLMSKLELELVGVCVCVCEV
jgi:hypothetical protein